MRTATSRPPAWIPGQNLPARDLYALEGYMASIFDIHGMCAHGVALLDATEGGKGSVGIDLRAGTVEVRSIQGLTPEFLPVDISPHERIRARLPKDAEVIRLSVRILGPERPEVATPERGDGSPRIPPDRFELLAEPEDGSPVPLAPRSLYIGSYSHTGRCERWPLVIRPSAIRPRNPGWDSVCNDLAYALDEQLDSEDTSILAARAAPLGTRNTRDVAAWTALAEVASGWRRMSWAELAARSQVLARLMGRPADLDDWQPSTADGAATIKELAAACRFASKAAGMSVYPLGQNADGRTIWVRVRSVVPNTTAQVSILPASLPVGAHGFLYRCKSTAPGRPSLFAKGTPSVPRDELPERDLYSNIVADGSLLLGEWIQLMTPDGALSAQPLDAWRR